MINLRKTLRGQLACPEHRRNRCAGGSTILHAERPDAAPERGAVHGRKWAALGDYWLTNQGYWGVMGSNEPLGNIYAGSSSSTPHRSLSERGMLYYPEKY